MPDSRLVYARDDLAGGPRSKGGVDDAPAEGAADGEATIDVAGWAFHGGGWKDELQEYASKARAVKLTRVAYNVSLSATASP